MSPSKTGPFSCLATLPSRSPTRPHGRPKRRPPDRAAKPTMSGQMLISTLTVTAFSCLILLLGDLGTEGYPWITLLATLMGYSYALLSAARLRSLAARRGVLAFLQGLFHLLTPNGSTVQALQLSSKATLPLAMGPLATTFSIRILKRCPHVQRTRMIFVSRSRPLPSWTRFRLLIYDTLLRKS